MNSRLIFLSISLFLAVILVLSGCITEEAELHEHLEFDIIRSSATLNDHQVEVILRRSATKIVGFYIDKSDSSMVGFKGKMIDEDQFKLNEIHGDGRLITLEGSWNKLSGVWKDLEHQSTYNFALVPDTTFVFSFKNRHQVRSGTYQNIANDAKLQSNLEIEYLFDNLFFFETTINTKNCTGWTGGIAHLTTGNSAVFNDEDCELSFIFNEDQIALKEQKCNDYHGMYCSFEGTYLK